MFFRVQACVLSLLLANCCTQTQYRCLANRKRVRYSCDSRETAVCGHCLSQ